MKNNKQLDKEIQEWLRGKSNPKIIQELEVLEMNEDFLKDISILRKKWANIIKDYLFYLKKFTEKGLKILADAGALDKLRAGSSEPPIDPCTSKDKKELKSLQLKAYKPLENEIFIKDLIDLCKKYKVFPVSIWYRSIQLYVVYGQFLPTDKWFGVGLSNYASNEEILTMPKDLNFAIKIEENKETSEPELFIQIFENTSLGDIEKNWNFIVKQKDKLKKVKDIKKNYYPLKNLERNKKIRELDKQGKSDWEIQEEIFGEITDVDFGKIENKRKNLIKQTRHKYKDK